MYTPWGPLADLDLTSLDVCRQVLEHDKHQLAEGLVVESFVEQIYAHIPDHLPAAALLDVETAIVRDRGRWLAFVWVRSPAPGLGRFLAALANRFTVYVVALTPDRRFLARPAPQGRPTGEALALETLMAQLSGRVPAQLHVDAAVRDGTRQNASFWGHLAQHYRGDLGPRVILPRLFLNFGIQPWFRAVWNLDRILVDGDKIWFLEIKHKFPINGRQLRFGLNLGEADVIARLGETGVRCLHTLLVKPTWTKDSGAAGLLASLDQRTRALLIATELDAPRLARMRANGEQISGSHTALTGQGALKYLTLPASDFNVIGNFNSCGDQLAGNMAAVMSGLPPETVTDAMLRSRRN